MCVCHLLLLLLLCSLPLPSLLCPPLLLLLLLLVEGLVLVEAVEEVFELRAQARRVLRSNSVTTV
jgi:hypothetical protein